MMAVQPDVDLRLLGPVRMLRDGTEVAAGSGRHTAVLCVLALQPGRAVHRDELVAAVWGEDPPASAVGNVYSYVSVLRRALEPQRGPWSAGQLLSASGGSYRLDVSEDAVDVFRFEKLRERGRDWRAADDTAAELTALADALSLWHGDALAGVPGPYATAQRTRLAELRLATVERHASLLLDLGRHDEAIAALRELTDAYPTQEKFHGLLMTALLASGRRAEAMSTYQSARRLLAEATGAAPGAVLHDAYQRLTGDAATEIRPSPREPVLIGRTAEVRLLRQAAAQVVAGTGGHLRIEGGPGTGKSAVLDAALRQPRPAGYRIGWGRGEDSPSRAPLCLLIDCLDNAVPGRQPAWGARLRSAVAAAAPTGSGPSPAPAGPELVAAAVAAVRESCDEGPLILVIDDLQWADDATLRAWAALQRVTAQLPLLLVAAARPDRTTLDDLGWHGAMPLGPLSAAEASAVVDSVAAGPLDEPAKRRIVADAGGNPCYLLAGIDAAQRHDGQSGDGVPAELVTAVTRHLAVLSEPARQILRAAAFLGDGCGVAELATVTAQPVDTLLAAVRSARAAGFLTEFGESVTFRHQIVARVLHDATPRALRVMLHRSFAQRLAEHADAPDAVVAQLLAGPVPLDGAMCDWLVANIAIAAERAPRNALDLLRQVCRQPGLDPQARLALTASLARLLVRLEQGAAAEADWVAARTPDAALEAEMRWIVALSHERRGDFDAAAEVARWVLGARRAPDVWLSRFRELFARVRPLQGGTPTQPHERTVTGCYIR